MFGNLFNKAIALIMIPFLTRNMSTDEYGILNIYISWSAIFTVFIGLSLGSSFRSAFVDFRQHLGSYTSSLYFLSLIVGICISILICAIAWVYDFHMCNTMLICCVLQSFFIFVLDSISIKYMMEQKYVKRTLIMSLPNIIIAIFSIILILNINENKYWGRIIPSVAIYTLFGLIILFCVFKEYGIVLSDKFSKYALLYSLPLVFHALSCVVLSSSDRIMIERMRSTSESGIYSFIYNFSMAVKVVTGTLESIWIPWFTRKIIDNNKNDLNIAVSYYVEIVSVFVAVILLISPEIIKYIAPSEYWDGIPLSIPIILASFVMFLYSISVDLEYYYKSTKYIAKNTIIAASINLIFNILLIPNCGATGAAYTTVLAYTVSFILHYRHSRKLDNELFPFKKYIPSIIFLIFTCMITYVFIENTFLRYVLCLCVILSFIIHMILLKNKIFLLINKYE